MLCISIWKFLSFYEAVTWDIFLRLFAVFCWIVWNYIAIFIFISRCHFLIDVFCISFFVDLSFNNLVSWDVFSWFSSIFCWWKWVAIFINEWSIRTNCWSVSSCYWCTVLIYTFNCYTFSFTYEVRFWCEGYFTVFIDSVCSFTWYFLLSCAIVKCWFNSFIDFNWNFLTVDCNFSTFKCWCSWLSLSFRTFWFRIFWGWSYWNDYWSVLSCDWCSIFVNTFHCYTCCLTCEVLLWGKGYCTVLIDCVCSFTWYFLLSCAIIKCWFNSFIDFYSFFFTVNCYFSTFKCWCSFLSCTLNICSDYIWTCWCCWFHNWCVLSCDWCAVLIFALNCDTSSLTCEVLLWCKGNCSIRSYCVCSFAFDGYWINWISCFWIYQFSWFIFIDFNSFLFTIDCYCSTLEFRFTCLSWTLNIFSYSICSCWCYWFNFRCVCSFSWCAVLILTNYLNTFGYSCKLWFWLECYCSIWSYCVCSFTFYSDWINLFSSFWIYQFSWYCIVDFNSFLFTVNHSCSTLEYWFACLSCTLNIYSFSWFCCWCYRYDRWSISCRNFCSICVLCLNISRCNITCVRFICWCEGYFTCCWINWVSTYWSYSVLSICWSCLTSWNFISFFIKKLVRVLFDWSNSVSRSECWSSFLSFTLDSFWCSRFCCWNYRSNLRCVSCFYSCTILIFSLNSYWLYFTWICLICWFEYCNSFSIYSFKSVLTNYVSFWIFSWYFSSWLSIFT